MSRVYDGRELRATKLNVERGGRLVISDLSFSLVSGRAMLLTGPNGAGKTTLIRALAGLVPIRSGQLELSPKHEATSQSDDLLVGEQSHYIGHSNATKPELTVHENLAFWARFMSGNSQGEAAALHDLDLGALADIPVRYLSAGQQRRVALARLRVAGRPVWLLDEPTVSLDTANTERLVALGNAHLADGGMIIAATHTPLAFAPSDELRLRPVDIDMDHPVLAGVQTNAAAPITTETRS